MKLPEEMPVMVLPNGVLLPQAILPLRIFEPRYRQMLADCLNSERVFSVGLTKKGWADLPVEPPIYEITGIGLIRASARQPDGSSHLLLQGLARARILGYRQQKPYRIARVEILETRQAQAAEIPGLATEVTKLVPRLHRPDRATPESIMELLAGQPDPDRMTDLASDLLLSNPFAKQKLLETLDLRQRLHLLLYYLQQEMKGRPSPGQLPDLFPPDSRVGDN